MVWLLKTFYLLTVHFANDMLKKLNGVMVRMDQPRDQLILQQVRVCLLRRRHQDWNSIYLSIEGLRRDDGI